jgi:arsenate reductase
MKLIIWHNNVCSTSRKALDHLQNQGHEVSVRNYLTEAPSIVELQQVLEKLHHEAPYILRKKDKVFQEKFADKTLSNPEWIQAMHENPSIIERPIVISDKKAWLARPFDKWEKEFSSI